MTGKQHNAELSQQQVASGSRFVLVQCSLKVSPSPVDANAVGVGATVVKVAGSLLGENLIIPSSN